MGTESGSAGEGISAVCGSGMHGRCNDGSRPENAVFMQRYFPEGTRYAGRGRCSLFVFLR